MSSTFEDHHQRLRAMIGLDHTTRLGPISRRDLNRFAVACGDPDLAAEDAEGQLVAPPLFLSSVMSWGAGAAEDLLHPDGTSVEDTRGFHLDGLRLMGAGQDLEFHSPVQEGMSVVVHTRVENVQLKSGDSGPLLILRLLRRFTDDAVGPLVTCRETFIAR